MTVKMEDIVNLAKNRGFVYAGSEIYGGLANTWDYGPYGSILKDNIRNLWLKEFVQKRTDMVQLDAGILMNPQVWVASGHVGGFSDPLIDDKKTGERFRADKLLEDLIENIKEEFEGIPDILITPRMEKLADKYIEMENVSLIEKKYTSFTLEITNSVKG